MTPNAPGQPQPAQHSRMVLYAAADLIWASKIKGTADAIGVPARPVRTLDMLTARLADAAPTALIVDMDKGEEGLALIRAAREAAPALRIVAFGPHVAVELLNSAREAGADEVMTRGALDHTMTGVLKRLVTPSSKAGSP